MISSAARYDHFDTLPYSLAINKIHDYNGFVNIKSCRCFMQVIQ